MAMGEHADAVAELQHEIRTRQEVGIAAADLDEDGRLLPRQVEIAKCSAHHRRAGSKWKASYSDPLLRRLNAAPDTLLVVCRKHSAGVRTKAGRRHFCPKLTSALFAISVHKFAILAPDVLALPSRSHNRAFLRSDVPCDSWGVRGFLRATGTQSAAFLAQYLVDIFGTKRDPVARRA